MKNIIWIFTILLLISCNEVSQKKRGFVDSLNRVAYNIRYSDIDSTRMLAQRAYDAADGYKNGQARALNLLAYVDYQQMDFSSAFHKLDSVQMLTSNQIILLASDVMRMKINQRIGDGTAYFISRVSAQKRMKRAEEEYDQLQEVDRHDLLYARTEYHIISSTYCYYQDQNKEAMQEMAEIAQDFVQVTDSTQWLYYNYMMGSGGLIEGEPMDVAVKEFDYLMNCWGYSRGMGVTYFEANSLQALASLLSDDATRSYLKEHKSDFYLLLLSTHDGWLPIDTVDVDHCLPEALALHAVYCFRQYKDLFQTACAYRTLGEMAFSHGQYDLALEHYSMALNCVNEQFMYNNTSVHGNLLALYKDANEGDTEVELKWIESDSIYTVPEWIAGIRQKISMAFSALDMRRESEYNRSIYLDIIARTSQNVEMESRRTELQNQINALHFRLFITGLLFIILVALIVIYSNHLRKSNELRLKQSQNKTKQSSYVHDAEHLAAIEEHIEEVEEQLNLCALKIDTNKRRNAEKRAKVSLVHAVTPFLDRIINQIDRMNRTGTVDNEKLQYIRELTERIVNYNDLLTDWIKMERGELSLQIGTLSLDKIFETLQKGHYAFDQKGISLNVVPTDLVVKADEALTLFMLNTLADNSRKFTPEGGSVTISATGYDDYVELRVEDTGCGMSAEDVETLNNSKVYDSRTIGVTTGDSNLAPSVNVQESKGFGFGIMNCRGIIEKYRKTSSIFQVCQFGVESKLGEGSCFFFRLPRVLSVLCFLISLLPICADNNKSEKYYEDAYLNNVASQYEVAVKKGLDGLHELSPRLVLTREEELSNKSATNEVDMFLNGDSLDFGLAIRLRNEIASASLALHDWEQYKYNNTLCTSLYKLYHQDRTLPTYCERLQQTQSASRQLLMVLVLFSILVISFALLFLQRRMYLGKGLKMQQLLCLELEHLDEEVLPSEQSQIQKTVSHLLKSTLRGINGWQHIEGLSLQLNENAEAKAMHAEEGRCEGSVVSLPLANGLGFLNIFGTSGRLNENLVKPVVDTFSSVVESRIVGISSALSTLDLSNEKLNHLLYEEHRLRVQNQVLDNCLSTIKHESMYYPARILQLANRLMDEQIESNDNPELSNKAESCLATSQKEDIKQLTELSYYYKEIYTLLSGQAEKLIQQGCYKRELLNAMSIAYQAKSQFNKYAAKKHLLAEMLVEVPEELPIHVDAVLMEDLMNQFNLVIVKWYEEMELTSGMVQIVLSITQEGSEVKFAYRLPNLKLDENQAHSLFYPESRYTNLLVAKQIIRELDALNNYPGLRLVAESKDSGAEIWFTVK